MLGDLRLGATYIYVRSAVAYVLQQHDAVNGRLVLANEGEDEATTVDETYFRAHFRLKHEDAS